MPLYLRMISCILTCLLSLGADGQCDASVEAGDDATVCPSADALELNGAVDLAGGELLSVAWSPTSSVSDPNREATNFTGDETTELTFSASVIYAAENLLINGNFDDGELGWTTEYVPGPGGAFGTLSTEGTYAIDDNAADTHNNFAACGDHTGGGDMMVINGATTANEEIYCQMVTVMPNTEYAIRAWVQSVISANPARLQFSVNGDLVGGLFSPSSSTCSWMQFDDRWTSGATATMAEMCIVNQNTIGSGNDFALDDLYFGPVCDVEDRVEVTVIENEIVLGDELVLPCNIPGDGAGLSAVGSTEGPNHRYLWTTSPPGNIVSGETTLTPRVDQSGFYTFTITYDDGVNVCVEEQTISVITNPNVPNAVASVDGVLTCDRNQVALSSAGSSSGSSVEYFWEATVGGSFVGGQYGSFVLVDGPGTYTLTVVGFMGCESTATVEVTANLDAPTITVAPVGMLSCTQSSLIIDAGASDAGANITSSWTATDGGAILGGGDGYTPTVGSAGTYTFRLTNTATGCFTEEAIVVTGAPSNVIVQVNAMGEINCDGTGTADLSGAGSTSGTGVTYLWSTTDGAISGPADGVNATASAAGTYILTVTDGGGCSNSAFVEVTTASYDPVITLTSPNPFTCDRAQIAVMAQVISTDLFNYSWSTPDGNIVVNTGGANILIDQPGTYVVTVTNAVTNCTATESITIDPVDGLPIANANEDQTITCDQPTVFLDATGSSAGPNFTSVYEDQDGNVLGTIAITEGGLYRLIVTNTDNGCAAIDSVRVFMDTLAPNAPINFPGLELTCEDPELIIGTDQFGSGFTFQWSTPDGTFTGLPTAPSIAVDGAGTFTLVTTNPTNGCSFESTVTITENQSTPDLSANNPAVIDCQNPTQELMAFSSTVGPFVYEWTTPDGAIVSGATSLVPTISAGGVYQLIASNPGTGCADTILVNVAENGSPPPAEATGDDIFTCEVTAFELNSANPIPGDSVSYTWSTADGAILTEPGVAQVTVGAPGTYLLTVRNENTGCAATDSVVIAEDVTAPVNNLDEGDYSLSCNTTTAILRGVDSPIPGSIYTWQAPADNPQQSSGTEVLIASVGGDYTLTVRDPDNGCVTTRTVPVTLDRDVNTASLDISGPLSCRAEDVDLLGSVADPDGNFIYRFFDGSGATVPESNLVANVAAAGRYGFIVTNLDNGCMDTAFVDVTESFAAPSAEAGDPLLLNCFDPELNLDGAASTPGDTIVYQWSTPDGNLVGAADVPTPLVDAAGRYRLIVTNTINGCTATDSVEVTSDFSAPPLDLALSRVLTCREEVLTLQPTGGAVSGVEYTWFQVGMDGAPIAVTPDFLATEPGGYRLVATQPTNGCQIEGTVTVTEDKTRPTATILGGFPLTCTRTSLDLFGSAEGGGAIEYSWSTTDGEITTAMDGEDVAVTATGTYQLATLNPANGCTDTTTYEVGIDTLRPTVAIEPYGILDCRTDRLELRSDRATVPNGTIFEWTTVDGNFAGSGVAPDLALNAPGRYDLLVSNADNGCEQSLSFLVEQDTVAPTLQALDPATLTCSQTQAMVSAGSPEAGVAYAWSTTTGNIEGPANQTLVTVDEAGTYSLVANNATNGCSATTTWEVGENRLTPVVSLREMLDLGCDPVPTDLTAEVTNGDFDYNWSTLNGTIVGPTDTKATRIDGPGLYTFLAANTENDCSAMASIEVSVNTLDSFAFTLSPLTCNVQTARLQFNGAFGGFGPYLYSSDGGVSYGAGLTPRGLDPGKYELRAQDSRGCEAIDSITVDSFRTLEIDLPGFATYAIGDSTALTLTTNFEPEQIDTIIWAPARDLSCTDCLQPTASPSRTTTYDVLVRSIDGCVATALINVQVDERLGIYFPTGFSPNEDGRNDRFHPFADVDKVTSVTDFRIHDRWGNAVYEADEIAINDTQVGWDGMFRGKAVNPGVFVYSAVVTFISGQTSLVEGEVIVIR